jgi:hypothetical protein
MAAKKKVSTSQGKTKKTVKWGSSDAFYLRRSLAHVQRKLSRFNEIAPRLAVEVPDLPADELIKRIKKRKIQLVKEIAAAERKSKKKQWSGAIPLPYGSGGPWHVPPEFLERVYKPWPEGIMRKCLFFGGYTKPAYLKDQAYRRSWLNHDSTASYTPDDHYFDNYATILFRGELNDDASIWRDDNPDWIEWGTESGYYIPAPECDAIVSLEVSIRVISEFTNAADDGGSGFHSVAFAHTDANGNWPGDICDVTSIQSIMLELGNTGHYDSDWQTFRFSFNVKGGATPGLGMLLVTHLSAQDGKVESLGQWLISQRVYYSFEHA